MFNYNLIQASLLALTLLTFRNVRDCVSITVFVVLLLATANYDSIVYVMMGHNYYQS